MESSLVVYLYETNGDIEKAYSCFWIPPYLCDLLRLQAPEKGVQVAPTDMTPGHYYFLYLFDHHLSLIYLDPNTIYVIDYYAETNRSDKFRVTSIIPSDLNSFVQAILTKDIDSYADFHHGDSAYRQDLHRDIKSHTLLNGVFEQPLVQIDHSDILRVALKTQPSFPSSDVYDTDYTTEDFEDDGPLALCHAQKLYTSNL